LSLRLPVRAPFFAGNFFGHLAATAIPGVEVGGEGGLLKVAR
jgi:hypothetical protein